MATIHTSVPEGLIPLLTAHLPHSLPVLRRLQFTRFPGGQRPTARIILAADAPLGRNTSPRPRHFAAAYLDFGSGIETALFMYSTLEDGGAAAGDAAARQTCEEQILAVIDAVRQVGREQPEDRAYPGAVLVGTLATAVREVLFARGVPVRPRADYEYEKWLFRPEDVPDFDVVLPEGATWGPANERDCEVVISRTHIPRQVGVDTRKALMLHYQAFIARFQEPYRKRGYAKALAAQLFKRSTSGYGPDGWSSADVAPDNLGSRGMCKSLGGRHAWNCSWNIIQLEDEEVKS